MYVISSNYRDSVSDYPWLVRQEHQELDKAVRCKTVECKGQVCFSQAFKEVGFGCSVVAMCDTVAIGGVEPDVQHNIPLIEKREVVELKFDGYKTFYASDDVRQKRPIRRGHNLRLGSDKKIEIELR